MIPDVTVKVLIPFRDRGTDPRRYTNLERVLSYWWALGVHPSVISDGLEGDAPFNRHRAYNIAARTFPDADVYVFTEADMLVPYRQVTSAALLAYDRPGLVVPFTQYRYLSDEVTEREWGSAWGADSRVLWWTETTAGRGLFDVEPESTMDDGRSIGAVNVLSRATYEAMGGFTEATEGNWYDDNIVEEAAAYLTGAPTRWVPGPAVHLYHLPGHKGDHLTDEDRAATAHNKKLLVGMRADIRLGDRKAVERLMEVRK